MALAQSGCNLGWPAQAFRRFTEHDKGPLPVAAEFPESF